MSALGSVWNCLLDACIIIGGAGGLVSLYSCIPKLQIKVNTSKNSSYTVVGVEVRAINKYVVIKSIKVVGHKIARQIGDEVYGLGRLHCVSLPSDDDFVDSIRVNLELVPVGESESFVFVVKETDLANLEISFQIASWFLPIKYKFKD